MTKLCCTQALLDEIGINAELLEPHDFAAPPTHFGNWFVHVVIIERKKCLIFVNSSTLLSFVVPGIRRDQLHNLAGIFIEGLRRMLGHQGATREMIDAAVAAHGEVTIGSGTRYDWQVLDNLQDLVLSYRAFAGEVGGLDGDGLDRVIRLANETPRQINGARSSLKAWRRLMKKLPFAARVETQRQVIARLRQELGNRKERVIALYYISIIPDVFADLPELIGACHDNGMECTIPVSSVQSPADQQVHIRLHTMLTRLGIPMPERN